MKKLKKYALCLEERRKLCDHNHMAWSGRIPYTGTYRCTMCGYVKTGGDDETDETEKI